MINSQLKTIGFYALSGALTNWLAVIMLFDKLPFVYGSGVIPRQFQKFKQGIKHMILTQFFNDDYIEKYLIKSVIMDHNFLTELVNKINYDVLFNSFVDTVMDSQFGSLVETFLGGRNAIESVRENFKEKLKKTLH